MAHYKTETALTQAYADLRALNDADRDKIAEIERRIEGRTRLIRIARRRFRRQGLINLEGLYGRPYWVRKDML